MDIGVQFTTKGMAAVLVRRPGWVGEAALAMDQGAVSAFLFCFLTAYFGVLVPMWWLPQCGQQ